MSFSVASRSTSISAVGVILAGLSACAPDGTTTAGVAPDATTLPADNAACVPIPEGAIFQQSAGKFVQVSGSDGAYYQVVDSVLTEVEAPEPEIIERIVEAPQSWSDRMEASFPGLGFPWLKLDARNLDAGVVTLTGLAPTDDAKTRALAAGEAAIKATVEGSDLLVVDGISVEGGETAVGDALAELDDRPSVAACQTAFNETMDGRVVSFAAGGATINEESARLLDALTGVAILCQDYRIVIGGHTDTTGSALANQRLSEQRAQAVRTYLLELGVPSPGLRAVGFGEVQPLDPGNTPEAHARNRRVEFTVRAR
ncbi:MAG: OmpA family protein [Pseudomonadota bacterium]